MDVFATSINSSSQSVIGSANLITKIYFPRLIIPLAAVGAALVDLGVSFSILVAMMIYYGIGLSWQVVLVPVFLVGTLLVATGVGALLSALTVTYRDFQYVVPFMVQVWFFITPLIFPASVVPERYRWALSLNPLAGLIEGFRSAFLAHPFDWASILISLFMALLVFLAGASYFRAAERHFADVI